MKLPSLCAMDRYYQYFGELYQLSRYAVLSFACIPLACSSVERIGSEREDVAVCNRPEGLTLEIERISNSFQVGFRGKLRCGEHTLVEIFMDRRIPIRDASGGAIREDWGEETALYREYPLIGDDLRIVADGKMVVLRRTEYGSDGSGFITIVRMTPEEFVFTESMVLGEKTCSYAFTKNKVTCRFSLF